MQTIALALAIAILNAIAGFSNFGIADESSGDALRVTTVGRYQPGDVTIPAGQTVLALVEGDEGSELVYTIALIDTIYDEESNEISALNISVATEDSVSFVIYSEDKRVSSFTPGPVQSFTNSTGIYYPGQQRAFWVQSGDDEQWWMLNATGSATDSRESASPGDTYPLKIHNYHLKLHHHPQPSPCGADCRLLVEVDTILDEAVAPRVLWVGDLDRDSKLDVILSLHSIPEYGSPMLFLSSGVKEGKSATPVSWFAPVVMMDGC